MNLEVKDHIARITFAHPERANSLNEADWEALGGTFRQLGDDARVRVAVLYGDGKHFCAGMDLSVLGGLSARIQAAPDGARSGVEAFIRMIQASITAIEACPVPVIAAIHGGCIGGGLAIATACDFRYASEDAFFTVKEVDLGIVSDIGPLQRLPRLMPPALAAELAYTGRKLTTAEAYRAGLVNQRFADRANLLDNAFAVAKAIAAKDPKVIRGIKHNLVYSRNHTVAEGLDYVARYSAALLTGRSPK